MKYSKLWLVILCSSQFLVSCKSKSKINDTKSVQTLASVKKTGIVDIVAQDYKFFLPDSLPSGWLTVRFHNEGKETHFFLLNHLPEDKTYANYEKEIAPPFEVVWTALRDSGISQQQAIQRLGATLPKWSANIYSVGGSGLIEAGGTTETILKLVPGNYEMECYIKSPGGIFHSSMGMSRGIVITSDSTSVTQPQADINLTLSDHKIQSDDIPTAGKQTVAVHYKDPEPFGLGDDVHLVQVSDTTDLTQVIDWMNWLNIDGLRTPAPARFLGGVQAMPAGYTAYFIADLKPGRYAWIAESYASQGMVKEFSIK